MNRGRATNAYAELTFHMLACVPCAEGAPPLASAATLFDPSYLAWSESHGAPTDVIREDAGVVSALLADPHVASTISLLAMLHTSLEAFLETAALSLLELGPAQVAEPGAIAHLRAISSPAIEIVRADMALGARTFGSYFEAHARSRVEAVIERVASADCPGSSPGWLHAEGWELSLALGVHGRVFGSRVIVGAGHPEEPLEVAATRAHALICHERSVVRASEVLARRNLPTEWAWVERLSLAVERALVKRGALPPTHGDWLDSVSLEGLADFGRAAEDDLAREAIEAT